MSTLEVDKIIPQSGTNLQVGEASDTIKVPSGATLDIESGATLDATGATITGFDAASDEKVKVTANDTTPGFLTTKVLAGTNISLTVGNASNNETLTAAFTGNLNASITNAGTFADARIPNLNASKITAGTLDAGRIPNLNASKINAGTIATARLGSGTASSSTFLRGDGSFATPVGETNKPIFKVRGSNQTISHNTDTKMTIDSEDIDTDNCFDLAGTKRFVPNKAGKYFFTLSLSSPSGDDIDYWAASVRLQI